MNREVVRQVTDVLQEEWDGDETDAHRAERIVNLVEAHLNSPAGEVVLRGAIAGKKAVPTDPSKDITITVEFHNTLENAHRLMDLSTDVCVIGSQLCIPDTPAEDDASDVASDDDWQPLDTWALLTTEPVEHTDQTRLDEPEPEDDGLDDDLNEDDLV